MFNVWNMEEKYRDRERRGLPESMVEIDHHGNFYFPSTMAACHQQAFVNRMFQNDALFGKGSVSAPRNSIQSFEGDARALQKSVKDLDDDVFENSPEKYREYENFRRCFSENRYPTTSAISSSELDDMDSESNREAFADDEENSDEETTDETFSEDDELIENECDEYSTTSAQNTQNFRMRGSCSLSDQEKITETSAHMEPSWRKFSTVGLNPPSTIPGKMIKNEGNSQEVPPSEIGRSPRRMHIKKEVLNDTFRSLPSPENRACNADMKHLFKNETNAASFKNNIDKSKDCDVFESATILAKQKSFDSNEKCTMPKTTDHVTNTSSSYKPKDIRRFFKQPVKKEVEKIEKVGNDESDESVIVTCENEKKPTVVDSVEKGLVSTMALSERPRRIKKATEKMAAVLDDLHCHNHEQSTDEVSSCKKKHTKARKPSLDKEPYCKHCEYIKEEERKSKLNAKQLKEDRKNESVVAATVEPSIVPKVSKCAEEKLKDVSEAKKTNSMVKRRKSSQPVQTKRRSGTSASEEPEKKKQKLIDSDLISIPSSMAIIVDTELIATVNPRLTCKDIPMFSDNSPKQSVWNTTVDVEWIKDVKKFQGETKARRFFGVPVVEYPKDVPVINFWVDNLISGESRKDPFTTDYRRVLAQDKKARIDVKAGYDVRF
uniref:INCENP_ARK-bind domain-containing protein n=1 Tax=Caenorhabditis tropicalis TaxID=1561998 RepID=A0A1I7TKI4_9PELO